MLILNVDAITTDMNIILPFTTAILAWVFYDASATEASCNIGSRGSIFLPHEHHALIGHSFLNRSGTVRIQCMMLCLRHSRCLSFIHNDISGICQLNDARKEDFPDSYKQDGGFSYFSGSSNKAKPLPEETTVTTKTEQETSEALATTTKRITKVSMKPSTETPSTASAKAVDTEGPIVSCPFDVFGLTNDSYARTSVQWRVLSAYDNDEESHVVVTCRDDDEGRDVQLSGDSFKAGTTEVTCTAWDAAGNSGNCTFLVTITVCNITRLGMESGAITDNQITVKNVLNKDYANYGPALARLNSNGSWCGIQNTATWIQVGFNHTVDIYGLIIQGRADSYKHTKSFGLRYSDDGIISWMREVDRSFKEYISTPSYDDQDVVISVQTPSQRMIRTRFIRIYTWKRIGKNPCMRFEPIICN